MLITGNTLVSQFPDEVEQTIINQECSLNINYWKCIYTNAQSFRNKLPELRAFCVSQPPALIAVTETWLSPDILDSEVAINNLTIIRRDRINSRGGGVALYIPTVIAATILNNAPLISLPDSLWCSFNTADNSLCVVGVIYCSPNSSNAYDNLLMDALEFEGHLITLKSLSREILTFQI